MDTAMILSIEELEAIKLRAYDCDCSAIWESHKELRKRAEKAERRCEELDVQLGRLHLTEAERNAALARCGELQACEDALARLNKALDAQPYANDVFTVAQIRALLAAKEPNHGNYRDCLKCNCRYDVLMEHICLPTDAGGDKKKCVGSKHIDDCWNHDYCESAGRAREAK